MTEYWRQRESDARWWNRHPWNEKSKNSSDNFSETDCQSNNSWQCALEQIYHSVIPEVKIVDVLDTRNVMVVVGVDESIQVPYAIQDSTRVYIRTGSI